MNSDGDAIRRSASRGLPMTKRKFSSAGPRELSMLTAPTGMKCGSSTGHEREREERKRACVVVVVEVFGVEEERKK